MITRKLRSTLALTLAAGALAVQACDEPAGIESHLEVDGFALLDDASQIYRYTLDDGTAPTLTLTEGLHEVIFVPLDHDGQPIVEEDDDDGDHEEDELQITISDPSVLTWTPEADDGEAHTRVEFHGELNAIRPASTTMTVCVPHEGHCDFEVDVPVSVISP